MSKMEELRALTPESLNEALTLAQKDLFEHRMKHGIRQLENVALLKNTKHRIAQIKTVLREKNEQQVRGGSR